MVWTFPNLLSFCRILIIPVLVYLLTFNDRTSALFAAGLFLFASVTDYFDGYFARRNKSVSDLGKILDPLADKLMVASALIMWWPVVSPLPGFARLSEPGKGLYLFLQSIVPTVPASFLTFADKPIYHFYESVPRMGVSVVTDQRIAGLFMKIGGGLLLWTVIAFVFFRWNAREEEGEPEPVISWDEFERELEVLNLRKG